MIVMKFGGTSVQDSAAFNRTIDIIRSRLDKSPVIVLSATAGTTDALERLCINAKDNEREVCEKIIFDLKEKHHTIAGELISDKEKLNELLHSLDKIFEQMTDLVNGIFLLSELSKRSRAKIITFGELLSTNILVYAMNDRGINSTLLDSRDFIITSDEPLGAEPDMEKINEMAAQVVTPVVSRGEVPVVQGFISRSHSGDATTLGRGGSDYTASLLGCAIGSHEIEIWTDVDGILTADPRRVPATKLVKEVTFREAAELAFFGAKVLHPSTITPAVEKGIPVRVLNSHNPESYGTLIKDDIDHGEHDIKSITCKENIKVVNIYSPRMLLAHGFLKNIFEIFDRHKTSVDLITTSEVNVSLTLDNEERINDIIKELEEFSEVSIEEDKALVCVIGKDIKNTKGIATKIFDSLDNFNITMISQGASLINLSFVVERKDLNNVVQTLHDKFFS
jgi:aspartate kinase